MTEMDHVAEEDPLDEAARAADALIRAEALRQLASIDCEDDDWRIEPLPSYSVEPEMVPVSSDASVSREVDCT